MKSGNVTVEKENIHMENNQGRKAILMTPFVLGENGDIIALARRFDIDITMPQLRGAVRSSRMPDRDDRSKFFPFHFQSGAVLDHNEPYSSLNDVGNIHLECKLTFGKEYLKFLWENDFIINLSELSENNSNGWIHFGVYVPDQFFYAHCHEISSLVAMTKRDVAFFARCELRSIRETNAYFEKHPHEDAEVVAAIKKSGAYIGLFTRTQPTFLQYSDFIEILKGMKKFEQLLADKIAPLKADLARLLAHCQ